MIDTGADAIAVAILFERLDNARPDGAVDNARLYDLSGLRVKHFGDMTSSRASKHDEPVRYFRRFEKYPVHLRARAWPGFAIPNAAKRLRNAFSCAGVIGSNGPG